MKSCSNMNEEFITSAGKLIVNNKRLLIQDLKFSFQKTAIGEITVPILFIVCIFFSFIDAGKPFSFLAPVIFSGVFLFYYFKQLFTALFKKSYSNYIPLKRIKSFEVKPDEFGLETEVRLYLKNGRYRSVVFRTLENQYQHFTEILSQYIIQPQFA